MSYRMQISPRSRKAARFISGVHKQLQSAYIRAAKRGVTQQEIATSLEVDRSTVNKRILGQSNLTLRSISDLAWAMGENVRLVIEPADREGRNFAEPVIVHTQGSGKTRTVSSVPSTTTTHSRERNIVVTEEHV